MKKAESVFRTARSWFLGLSQRERVLVSAAGVIAAVALLALPVRYVQENFGVTDDDIKVRSQQLADIGYYLKRYQQLTRAVADLETSYNRSKLTFEQVTNELDRIVKESIGTDNYDLKRSTSSRPVGEALELQDFSLRVRSLTLDQLVQLLHQLENGKSPLFLNRVDVVRDPGNKANLSATLEISTVGQKRST